MEDPDVSRARGGTAHGGVLLTPPADEIEDYFGIGGNVKNVRTISTASFLACAPGVAFALGTPASSGGMNVKGIVIGQVPAGNDPLIIYQLDSAGLVKELFGGQVDQGTGEVVVAAGSGGNQALRIPRGTTAQRPATLAPSGGEIRINTNIYAGEDTIEFWDAQVTTGPAWRSFREDTQGNSGSRLIGVETIGSPDFDSLERALVAALGVGVINGGVLTDGGSQTIDYSAVNFTIRSADDHDADLVFSKLAASSTAAIPTDTVRWIGIEYNSGTPQVVVKTTDTWNDHDEFPLGVVVNEFDVLHITCNPQLIADFASHANRRLYDTEPFARGERTGGLILDETGTRNLTVSAGALYDRAAKFDIAAVDTSGSPPDEFDIYYRGVTAGTFDQVASQTQWDNDSYDDDTGVLGTMTAAKYAMIWFYIELDGTLVAQYGRGQYATAALAAVETLPATAPDRITYHATPIGRLIFQKSAGSSTQIDTVFTPPL